MSCPSKVTSYVSCPSKVTSYVSCPSKVTSYVSCPSKVTSYVSCPSKVTSYVSCPSKVTSYVSCPSKVTSFFYAAYKNESRRHKMLLRKNNSFVTFNFIYVNVTRHKQTLVRSYLLLKTILWAPLPELDQFKTAAPPGPSLISTGKLL